jgi:hypothetical protein
MAASKLSDLQKSFVVRRVAAFEPASAIRDALKREHGVEITAQGVERYDPTKAAGVNLADRWRVMFDESRATYLSDQAGIGISHRAVRLRAIDRMAAKAESMNNMSLAAQLLEQAAKEVGGMYTNRREHIGADGKGLAVIPPAPVVIHMPNNSRD